MASSLTGKKHQISSNCGICLEKYRNPRRLRCQHYFCEDCLEDWIKHKRGKIEKIVCPTCKRKTPIPAQGVTGFPVVKMAQAKEDYSNKLCSKCKKPDLKAVVYCQDCEHYLCQSCLDVHNTWWEGHHSVASIEDMVSGKVTLADTKHKYCVDHEEEQNKFYCKTCNKLVCRDCILMVQHCRDHKYVTLKEAAKEKVSVIEEKMKKCDGKKKECRDALEKIKTVMTELDKAADDACVINEKVESSYIQQINEFFRSRNNAITSIAHTRKQALDSAEKNLQNQLEQLQRAGDRGKSLAESTAPHDIVATCDALIDTLEQLSKINLTEVDDGSVDILGMPIPPASEFSKRWKLVGQFNVPCRPPAESNGPTGIAVASDGKIAVCDHWRRVLLLSRSGNVIHTIIDDSLGGRGDVSITPIDGYAIPMYSKCCQLYDKNYKLLSTFKTCDAKKETFEAKAVSVDLNGSTILLGNRAISIQNADGSLKSNFAIPTKNYNSVTVTSRKEIAATCIDGTLQLYNYSGKCIQTLDPPPEVTTWVPFYVCCSKKDELFVVNRGGPKAIYKYAAGRVYMGCVTTEVSDPWGIALSHDDQELYVTEESEKVVKIFRKP